MAKWPARAVAAATAGETRWVRPPRPWRPSKLRLDVDTQYWPGEWTDKKDWGHCTVDYAVRVAVAAGVRRLVLFHHDPAHDDAELDRMLVHARDVVAGTSVEEVVAAAEGLTISLSH